MTTTAAFQSASAESRAADPRARASANSYRGWPSAIGNQATLRMKGRRSDRPLVQRSCACAGSGSKCSDTDVQMSMGLDTPGDQWETEADRVADAVVSGSGASLYAPQMHISSSVGRGAAALNPVAPDVGEATGDRITSRKGRGVPLPDATRTFMEPRLQSDLRRVRVHTDSAANELNTHLHSYAFTSGSDIFFAAGQYRPGSTAGRRLLAHELVHTLQQGASRRFVQRDSWGDLHHKDIQERLLKHNQKIATETPIPGATPSATRWAREGRFYIDLEKVGRADVYTSYSTPIVVSGVRGEHTPHGLTFGPMRPLDTAHLQPRPQPAQPAPPGPSTVLRPRLLGHEWLDAPGFPGSFAIGEIKPLMVPSERGAGFLRQRLGSEKRGATGIGQAGTLVDAFKQFVDRVYTEPTFLAALPAGANRSAQITGKVLDFADASVVTIPPEIDYRRFDDAVRQTVQPNAPDIPLWRDTWCGPNGNSRTWVCPATGRMTGLLWYFDLCHPFPNLNPDQVNPLLQRLDDLRARLEAPATGAPRPQNPPQLKRRPGSPSVRIQRKVSTTPPIPDKAAETKWATWKTEFDAWNTGSKGQPGAEKFLKDGQAVQVHLTRLDIDKELGVHPANPIADDQHLAAINRWSKSGHLIGWLRFTFGWAFDKIVGFLTSVYARVKTFVASHMPAAGAVAGGWEAKAFEIIKDLFLAVAKEFAASAYNLVTCCVTGVIRSVFDSILDTASAQLKPMIQEVLDKLEQSDFFVHLKSIYQRFENLYSRITTWEPIISKLEKALQIVDEVVRNLRLVAQIERALRLLVEAISCVTPPALGCLWGLVAQLGFDEIAGRAIASDLFKERIAKPAAKKIMEASIGRLLRGWLQSLFKGIGLDDFAKDVGECNQLKTGGGLPSAAGGEIATSFDRNDPQVARLRGEIDKTNPPRATMIGRPAARPEGRRQARHARADQRTAQSGHGVEQVAR